jgi:hypothetical protein
MTKNTSTTRLATAFLALAGACALPAQTTVFQFGPSSDYISGKEGFGGTDPRYESGNQAFNQSGSTAAQTTGNRAYSETITLTGPAEGRNVGGTPTSGNAQTFSGYSGPAIYGGYTVTNQSTATFATSHNPFVGYGTTNATATSGTYFQTGLRNGLAATPSLDRLVVNAGFGASPTVSTSGNRIYSIDALFTASISGPLNTIDSIAYTVANFTNVRAVVKVGEQYYVSNTALTAASSTFTTALLESYTWSEYNPLTSLSYAATGTESISLSSVSFAGVLVNRTVSQTATAGNTVASNFSELTLSGLTVTAIPEPSAFAALAGLGALGLAATRRRRR